MGHAAQTGARGGVHVCRHRRRCGRRRPTTPFATSRRITSSASGSSGASVTIATPACRVQPRTSASDGGRRCCERMGAAPRRVQERTLRGARPSERAPGCALARPTRASPRSRVAIVAADDEITVGMNDVTPHSTRNAATSPIRSGCGRQVDADRAVHLQIDEAGQHRAAASRRRPASARPSTSRHRRRRCASRRRRRPRRRARAVDGARRRRGSASDVMASSTRPRRRARRGRHRSGPSGDRRIDHPHPCAEVERAEELGLPGVGGEPLGDRVTQRHRRAPPRRR